jgi:mbt repeat
VKILGLILLILGIMGGLKACTTTLPPTASHSYNMGQRLGRLAGAMVFIGGGLWLLLRDRGRAQPPMRSRLRTPAKVLAPPPRTAPPPPPVPPSPIPVKIQCGCGQNYDLEILPMAGGMPAAVTCPACGADGMEAAKGAIMQANVARARPPAWPKPDPVWKRLHPAAIAAIAAGAFVLVLVLVWFGYQFSVRNRPRPIAKAPSLRSSRPEGARLESARPQGGRPSSPGWSKQAAPVPANVTAVDVLWGGRWWPATIVKREGERAFIHYDGWASSQDEWVTPDRLRPR